MSWLDALSESRPGRGRFRAGTGTAYRPPAAGTRAGPGTTSTSGPTGRTSCCRSAPCSTTRSGGERYWTRPGKDRRNGHSATTGYADDADRLKVFTPHWPPFADGEVYTKFGAYALLNHGGDHQAAARELSRLGYGSQQPAQAPPAGRLATSRPRWGRIRRISRRPTAAAHWRRW